MKESIITTKVPQSVANTIREFSKRNGVNVAVLYAQAITELAERLATNPDATVTVSVPALPNDYPN
jgi:hypothetical protein